MLAECPGLDRPIRIYVSADRPEAAERIMLSSGTRVADRRRHGDNGYERGARVPREPWRLPTKQELAQIVSPRPPADMARSVCIIKLPGRFTVACRDAIRSRGDEAIASHIVQPLRSICDLGEPLHCIGPVRNSPNLRTVTVNRELGRLIGLHVDNWDRRALEDRDRSTNRICINIGECDRYFLFLPFTLMAIARALSGLLGPGWAPPCRHSMIGREFMKRFPDVPVIRCRLAPGEAYVAPTENLVHDGSSEGERTMDEQFTVRGHIKLRVSRERLNTGRPAPRRRETRSRHAAGAPAAPRARRTDRARRGG